MALNIQLQLAMSKGLSKAIVFHGLDFPMVIHPTIHGDPILTSQAFYYLEQLECTAEIRFESGTQQLSHEEIEYLVDNYLFEYSVIHDSSRINTKVTDFKFWRDPSSEMYRSYDQCSTRALVLDESNDESVLCIKSLDEDGAYFHDYCLVKAYSDDIIEKYVSSLSEIVQKKIHIGVMPTSERDGYSGKARLLECDHGLLDYYQASQFEYGFGPRDIKPEQKSVTLRSVINGNDDFELPVETVFLKRKYSPVLLSYYFSGLKELNPLLSFIGFYNVLEYYFEEAPIIVNRDVKGEKNQIECVCIWLVDDSSIDDFIALRGENFKNKVKSEIKTSSNISIAGFDIDNCTNKVKKLAHWLYSIGCAVVHSKKSRNQQETAIFKPYSPESSNVEVALPLIKWLAIKCIQKDSGLSASNKS